MSKPSIHTLDVQYLGVPGSIACFLVIGQREAALVEAGPASTIDTLREAMAEHGVAPRDVRHVLVTHIHLDHAGAAGWLAEHGAMVHVHEFGAPHLVDPSKLLASAELIYGEEMERLWGRMRPVRASQVNALRDGDVVHVAGLEFRAIATPGHAKHHHAFEVEHDGERVCFTGDAAGTIMPGVPGEAFLSLPTPPPEFDEAAWLESLSRLEARSPRRLYLTHFGAVENAKSHLAATRKAVTDHWMFIQRRADAGIDEGAILEEYRTWVLDLAARAGIEGRRRVHFVSDRLLAMNGTGMLRRWRLMRDARLRSGG